MKLPNTVFGAKRLAEGLVLCPGGREGCLVAVPLQRFREDQQRKLQLTAHPLPPFAPGKNTAAAAGLAGVPDRPWSAVASYFDCVVQLDLQSGAVQQRWKLQGLDASEVLCWLTPSVLVVGSTRGRPFLLSARGEVLERLPVEGALNADVGGGGEARTLAIVDWDGVLWALDGQGQVRWRRRGLYARDRTVGEPSPPDVLLRSVPSTAVCVDPRAELIASGGAAGEVLFWNASDGALRGVFEVAQGAVRRLAWSHDGRLLVGDSEGTVYLVRVD
jgi:hypothetical protein